MHILSRTPNEISKFSIVNSPGNRNRAAAAPVRRALVADDDPVIRELLARGLEVVGFQVHKAENGRLAYDRFLKDECHLVVTDFQMPVMDGMTLIKKIKAKSPCMPIILISGMLPDDLNDVVGNGAVEAILRKPFSLDQLQQAALRAVGPKRKRGDRVCFPVAAVVKDIRT